MSPEIEQHNKILPINELTNLFGIYIRKITVWRSELKVEEPFADQEQMGRECGSRCG